MDEKQADPFDEAKSPVHIAAAVLIGLFSIVRMAVSGEWADFFGDGKIGHTIFFLFLQSVVIFAVAFALLSLFGMYYQKRQKNVADELDD